MFRQWILLPLLAVALMQLQAQRPPSFRAVAFFTGKNDLAHISFVNEAVNWFPKQATRYHFQFDTTSNWSNLNDSFLQQADVVIFLDTRPEDVAQRAAFQRYLQRGGAWMGFHFSAFALAGSAYPDNWKWYQDTLLGCGNYRGNTWRPTAAWLKVEDSRHPATRKLPLLFRSAPNEWYSWEKDLREDPDIDILLSIDSSSFPLGTGPKPYEIWHSGYYPVAWTNRNYRMIYVNMGHNDMDYEHHTNAQLSSTFQSKEQSRFIVDALLWLGKRKASAKKK